MAGQVIGNSSYACMCAGKARLAREANVNAYVPRVVNAPGDLITNKAWFPRRELLKQRQHGV